MIMWLHYIQYLLFIYFDIHTTKCIFSFAWPFIKIYPLLWVIWGFYFTLIFLALFQFYFIFLFLHFSILLFSFYFTIWYLINMIILLLLIFLQQIFILLFIRFLRHIWIKLLHINFLIIMLIECKIRLLICSFVLFLFCI